MISNEIMGVYGFLELHIYCALILMVLLPATIIYNRRRKRGTSRYAVLVYLFFFFMIVSDMTLMFLQYKGIGSPSLYFIVRSMSFISYSLSGYFWFLTCESEIGTLLYKDKLMVVILSIPILFAFIIEVSNKSHEMLFSFDAAGNYIRGTGFYLIAIVNLFYLLFSIVHTLYFAIKHEDSLYRKEYRIIAIVGIVFITAVIIHCFTGINCLCIGATGGLAIYYQVITAGLNIREERRAKQREDYLKMDNESLALAVGTVYNLVFSVNLSQNTYHVLGHDGEMALQIPVNGIHDDLIRGGMMNIPDKEDRDYFYDVLYRENQLASYKKGKRRLELRYKELGADGVAHWVKTVVIFLKDTEDVKQITFVKNIDEEIKLENIVEEVNSKDKQAKDSQNDLLNLMSHDVLIPINSVIGMTEIAQRCKDDPVRISDCLNKIGTTSQHLLCLVQDVTDMNSIKNGNIKINNTRMNITDFTGYISEILKGLLVGRDITFLSNISVEHINVKCDEILLKKAVLNILSNAVRLTPDGGSIEFDVKEASLNDDKVRIKMIIGCNGNGMHPGYLKDAWNPYSQENSALRSNNKGSGFEMAIAKHFIELMNGVIYVDSDADKGISFTIDTLFECDNKENVKKDNEKKDSAKKDSVKKDNVNKDNIVKGNAKTDDSANEKALKGKIEGMKVLLAEDSIINQEITKTLLEDYGIIVDTADNGSIAVEKFKNSAEGYYDYILMDIMMPIMDGLAATRAIRSLRRKDAERIRIVAMTGNDNSEDVQKSLDAGMNAHLTKPIDMNKLISIMSK